MYDGLFLSCISRSARSRAAGTINIIGYIVSYAARAMNMHINSLLPAHVNATYTLYVAQKNTGWLYKTGLYMMPKNYISRPVENRVYIAKFVFSALFEHTAVAHATDSAVKSNQFQYFVKSTSNWPKHTPLQSKSNSQKSYLSKK